MNLSSDTQDQPDLIPELGITQSTMLGCGPSSDRADIFTTLTWCWTKQENAYDIQSWHKARKGFALVIF